MFKLIKMIKQIPTQIYKSEARGVFKTENHNCFATFNFADYQDLSRKPFGTLQILNEEILGPNQRINVTVKENTNVVILPLFGGVEYSDNHLKSEFLRVDQIKLVKVSSEMSFEIFNPYENEIVSYLQIDFLQDLQFYQNHSELSEIDFTSRNKMLPLFEIGKNAGFIGVYDGRKHGSYTLRDTKNGVFVFVINGAFEVEDRLLEAKDGLSLKKVSAIEWEALSENAVLLVFEVILKQIGI